MNRNDLEVVLGRTVEALGAGEPVTLAVVVAVTGSAYRRRGAAMAVGDSWTVGGVSAGCVEADVVLQAREAREAGRGRMIEYDTGDRSPFGLGVGCGGRVRIALVPLTPAELPDVRMMAAGAAGEVPWEWVLPLGGSAEFRHVLPSPDHLHLYGGGADSEPIAALAARVGFRVSVFDHRPARISAWGCEGPRELVRAEPGDVRAAPPRAGRVFAVIKTHDLDRDRGWLRVLRASEAAYLGLMGPTDRVTGLIRETGGWDPRIRAPVGLDLGGEGPDAVALSVVAELTAVASGSMARPLGVGPDRG